MRYHFLQMLDWFKCQQLLGVHALSAPAKLLKRAQLFLRESSFARHPVQQGIPIMSPVMVQSLVDVSAASNQGPHWQGHAVMSQPQVVSRHSPSNYRK